MTATIGSMPRSSASARSRSTRLKSFGITFVNLPAAWGHWASSSAARSESVSSMPHKDVVQLGEVRLRERVEVDHLRIDLAQVEVEHVGDTA